VNKPKKHNQKRGSHRGEKGKEGKGEKKEGKTGIKREIFPEGEKGLFKFVERGGTSIQDFRVKWEKGEKRWKSGPKEKTPNSLKKKKGEGVESYKAPSRCLLGQ